MKKRRLLITLRHPGPDDLIRALRPSLEAMFEVFILAERRHAPILASTRPISRSVLLGEDEGVIEGCRRTIEMLRPDIVLRTTPAFGDGVDENIGRVLRSVSQHVPLFCIQDYYGVGNALDDADHLATMDSLAAELIAQRWKRAARVVGWVAHERFLGALPWREARQAGRRRLRISDQERLVLWACGATDPIDDRNAFRRFLKAAARVPSGVLFSVRPHPRNSPPEASGYRDALRGAGLSYVDCDELDGECERLAAPDVVASAASAMNIDAMAYHAAWNQESDWPDGATVSLYLNTEESSRAMRWATGVDLLPTHRDGRGSFVARAADLTLVLMQAVSSMSARMRRNREAARLFTPLSGTARAVCGWLNGD